MSKLNIGVEIRDFDLERMGFSLSVLDETKKRQSSEAYLRMTLTELNTFLKALKAAERDIDVSTVEPSGVSKLPTVKVSRPRDGEAAPEFRGWFLERVREELCDAGDGPRL